MQTQEARAAALLTTQEVSRRTGLAAQTLFKWAKQRKNGIPQPIRFGPRAVRWDRAEVEAWIGLRTSRGAAT